MNPLPPSTSLILLLTVLTAALRGQCSPAWNHLAQLGFGTNGQVYALQRWDPDGAGPSPELMVVGGGFGEASGIAASNIALYDPATGSWSPLGVGVDGPVNALAVDTNGDLLVGGGFTTAGGVVANGIARWNGSLWQPIGVGFDVMPGVSVRALAVGAAGEIFAGGDFTASGANPMLYCAVWNGTAWQPTGAGFAPRLGCTQARFGVTNLAVLPNGDVVAGGQFELAANAQVQHLAVWNGTSWSGVPGAPAFGCVTCSRVRASGELVLGGWANGMPTLQQYDGSTWQLLGTPVGRPIAIAELSNGDLLLSRETSAGTPVLEKWLATGGVQQLTGFVILQYAFDVEPIPSLAPDAFLAGGNFVRYGSPSATARGLLLWDGTMWIASPGGTVGGVSCLGAMPNGDVIAGGSFTQIAGVPATNVARWNGTTWLPVGIGPQAIYEVVATDSGEIYAATFYGVYRWDGTTWTQISTTTAWGVLVRRNGNVVAWDAAITEWDGNAWTTIPGAGGIDDVCEAPNGDLIAIGLGAFWPNPGQVGRWDGTAWTPLDPNYQLTNRALHVATGPGGSVIVEWTDPVLPGSARIYELVGTTWQLISSGFNGQALDLLTLPNGEMLVIGLFTTTGGPPTSAFAARWDGQGWQDVAGGPGQAVFDAVVRPSGELFISLGSFFSRTFSFVTSPCLPRSLPLGVGCPGAGGANRLTALNWPEIGAPYRARATELPPQGFAIDVIGLLATSTPLSSWTPLAPAGCTAFVTPLANSLLVPTAGTAVREFDVPASAALVGVGFLHQVFPAETDPQGALISLTATNALSLVVGSVL
ncbi:MAG: hypothetical protein KDE27_04380 [Planctomycetes bacterium]|nr:hypothetical protein [Planctomycetota bacterium]